MLEINGGTALLRDMTVTSPETIHMVAGVNMPPGFSVDRLVFHRNGTAQDPARTEFDTGNPEHQFYELRWDVTASDNGVTTWSANVYYRDDSGVARTMASNTVAITVDIDAGTRTNPPPPGASGLLGFIPAAGAARSVALQGNYAYVASDDFGLSVIDVSHPEAPVGVGATIPSFRGVDVAVDGTLAVVTGMLGLDSVLRVVDISDPHNPVTVAIVENISGNVDLAGAFAYVRQASKLTVFDLRTPSSPSVIGQSGQLVGVNDIAVVGQRAYVAGGSSFYVFDVSNPASPQLLGSDPSVSGGAGDVAVHGGYAFVSNFTKVHVYNVSNPASPTLVTSIPSGAGALTATANRLYLAGSALKTYDTSNPTAPALMGVTDDVIVHAVAASGSRVFATSPSTGNDAHRGGLYILDAQNGSAISVLAQVPSTVNIQGIAALGSLAVTTSLSGLRVVDTGDPTHPVVIAFLEGYFRGVALSGNYAYVRVGTRLGVVDLTTPTNPRLLDEISLPGGDDIVIAGSHAYVTAGGTLRVFSLSNPVAPQEVGSVSIPNGALNVAVDGNYAFVGNFSATHIVNVSNPASPRIVGSFSGGTTGVAASQGHLYVAAQSAFRVVDVSSPTSPALRSTSDGFGAVSVAVVGNRAYVGTSQDGVVIYDVTDPVVPVLEEQVVVPGMVPAIATDGNYVYAADSAATLDIFWAGP